jgi:hypothetical protein
MSDDSRIADLERRVTELERARDMSRTIGPIRAEPARQPLPFPTSWPQIPTIGESKCPTCGITLSLVMGYVCSKANCPTGLGGVYCSARA